MQQTSLFENREPLARSGDEATSHRAAVALTESGKRSSQKWQLLKWMRCNGATHELAAMTSAEIAEAGGFRHPMVHKRLPDLLRDGYVHKWHSRKCGVTHNECVTWYTTLQAVQYPD